LPPAQPQPPTPTPPASAQRPALADTPTSTEANDTAPELGARGEQQALAENDTPADASMPARSAKVETECSALCASASETCSHKSARECRANCGKYQTLADRCEVQILGAIRCQAAIPKFVCSNLASECTQQFQALSACEAGAEVTPPVPSNELALPSGWQRVRDIEVGFEIALPAGAKVGELGGHRTWTAEGPLGVNYLVAVLPPLAGAATEKRLMEAVLRYLGHACQPAVRLHGRFETDHDVAERFNARCENGRRWRGILRASGQQLLLIAEVLAADQTPVGDAYYYSFEYLK
jgi:hypothetical protein